MADYIYMVEELIRITREHGVEEKIIDDLLEKIAQSEHKNLENLESIRDLVEGQCRIEKMFRIDRENDPNTISTKIFDFSYGTIKHLREQGYNETLRLLSLPPGWHFHRSPVV